jgi:hypothetical protein
VGLGSVSFLFSEEIVMATNPLPGKLDLLFALAEDMADGAAAHQAAIGLLQNTEARIRADLTAAQTAENAYQTARLAKVNSVAAQNAADSNGKAFIATAKNVLSPILGGSWSTAWAPAGFTTSLSTPVKIAERMTLLGTLRDYFTAQPTHENAPLGVTSAQAATLFTALSNARSAVNQALVDVGQTRSARDAARRTLEKRMRGLIGELEQLLAADDPRWLAFGLNMPDAAVTPEAPSSVVLTLGGAGEVLADWDDVANASHYRVFKQEVGVDADFVFAGSPSDSDFLIAGVGGGHLLRVKVTVVSGGLESPPSPVAEITLGSAAEPVTLSGSWNASLVQAELIWTASTSPNVQVYQLRGSNGPTYNEAESALIGNFAPTTLGTPTLFGLVNPGDQATFKVFVILTTGNQAGSNPVTVTRT